MFALRPRCLQRLLRMRLCGSAKKVLDCPHASRSLEKSAQEQACCSKPGRTLAFARNSRQPAKPQLVAHREQQHGCDRAAGYRIMPTEADATPVRHLRSHTEEQRAHRLPGPYYAKVL